MLILYLTTFFINLKTVETPVNTESKIFLCFFFLVLVPDSDLASLQALIMRTGVFLFWIGKEIPSV